MTTKHKLIYETLIEGQLPGYTKIPDAEDLNIERLVEKRIAQAGNLQWVGNLNLPYDFDDYTDAKTTTLNNSDKKSPYRYFAYIEGTECKVGGLRVVAVIPALNKIDYFFIPLIAVRELERQAGKGKTRFKKRISIGYSIKSGLYCKKLRPYKCDSFEEMCLKSEVFTAEPLMKFTKTLKNNTQSLDNKGLRTRHKIVQI